jgi:hypothetical protein
MRKPAGERGSHGLSTVVREVWDKREVSIRYGRIINSPGSSSVTKP